jgi:hypothetical protein
VPCMEGGMNYYWGYARPDKLVCTDSPHRGIVPLMT